MAQTTDAAIRRIIQNAEESAKKPIASFTKEEFLSLVFSRAELSAYIELLTSLFGEKKHSAEWQLFARYKQYRAYQRFFFPMLDPHA